MTETADGQEIRDLLAVRLIGDWVERLGLLHPDLIAGRLNSRHTADGGIEQIREHSLQEVIAKAFAIADMAMVHRQEKYNLDF